MKRFLFGLLFLSAVMASANAQNVSNLNAAEPGLEKFEGSYAKNKTNLHWSISGNEQMNLFEVERSLDGKAFTTAAIVFTSEDSGDMKYAFKETIKSNSKVYYRIKMVEKDKKATYSSILVLNNQAS